MSKNGELVVPVEEFDDAILPLSAVKSYWKTENGKIVHVLEYVNKVIKKPVEGKEGELDYKGDGAKVYDIPGHGAISVAPDVKVYKTGGQGGHGSSGHHILYPGKFTLKNQNGEVSKTAPVMHKKIQEGKLAEIEPVQNGIASDEPVTVKPPLLHPAAEQPLGTKFSLDATGQAGWKKINEDGPWAGIDGDGKEIPEAWLPESEVDEYSHNWYLHLPDSVVANYPIGTSFKAFAGGKWVKVAPNKWQGHHATSGPIKDLVVDDTHIEDLPSEFKVELPQYVDPDTVETPKTVPDFDATAKAAATKLQLIHDLTKQLDSAPDGSYFESADGEIFLKSKSGIWELGKEGGGTNLYTAKKAVEKGWTLHLLPANEPDFDHDELDEDLDEPKKAADLPIGSTLSGGSTSGGYWKKTEWGTWLGYTKSGGYTGTDHDNEWIDDWVLGHGNWSWHLPVESTSPAPVSKIQKIANLKTKIAALPVGVWFEASDGESWTKSAQGSWFGSNHGHLGHYGDLWVAKEAVVKDWKLNETPTDQTADQPYEFHVPDSSVVLKVPAGGLLYENGTGSYGAYHIFTDAEGNGASEYTKAGVKKGGASPLGWVLTHDSTKLYPTDSSSDSLADWEKELLAKATAYKFKVPNGNVVIDVPVGSKLYESDYSDNQGQHSYWVVNSEGAVTEYSATNGHQNTGATSKLDFVIKEGEQIYPPDNSGLTEQQKALITAQGAPIGTKFATPSGSYWQKTSLNHWSSFVDNGETVSYATKLDFGFAGMLYQHPDWTMQLPGSTAAKPAETSAVNSPVGATWTHKSMGVKWQKMAPNTWDWISANGTSDSSHMPDSWVDDYLAPQAGSKLDGWTYSSGNANGTYPVASSLPVGSWWKKDTGDISYKKTGPNKWQQAFNGSVSNSKYHTYDDAWIDSAFDSWTPEKKSGGWNLIPPFQPTTVSALGKTISVPPGGVAYKNKYDDLVAVYNPAKSEYATYSSETDIPNWMASNKNMAQWEAAYQEFDWHKVAEAPEGMPDAPELTPGGISTSKWGWTVPVPPGGIAYQHGGGIQLVHVLDTTTGDFKKYDQTGFKGDDHSGSSIASWVKDYKGAGWQPLEVTPDVPPPPLEATYEVVGWGAPIFLQPNQTLYKTAQGNYLLVGSNDAFLLKNNGQATQPTVNAITAAKAGKFPVVAIGTSANAPVSKPNDHESFETEGLDTEKLIRGRIINVRATLNSIFKPQSYSNAGGSTTYSGLSSNEKANLLGSDEVFDTLKQAVADLIPVKAWKSPKIETASKQAIGKDRSRFDILLRASQLVRDVNNTSTTAEHVAEELAFLKDKMYDKTGHVFGADFPVDPQQMFLNVQAKTKAFAYNLKLKELGWDPKTADSYTMTEWAKEQGFTYAGVLTQSDLSLWCQAKLGSPDSYENDAILKNLQDKAGVTLAKTSIISQAEAILEASKKKAVDKQLPLSVTAATTSVAHDKNQLVSKYDGNSDISSSADNPDYIVFESGEEDYPWSHYSWNFSDEDYELYDNYDNNEMLEYASNGEWTASPYAAPVYGTSALDIKAKLDAFFDQNGSPDGMGAAAVNLYVKNHGGNYVSKMDITTKKMWIRFDILGDEVAKYAIESEAAGKSNIGAGTTHKNSTTHSGSPDSVAGAKAIQAQVDILATKPYGPALLKALHGSTLGESLAVVQNEMSTSQVAAAFADLDLKALLAWPLANMNVEHISPSWKRKALSAWIGAHRTQIVPINFDTDFEVSPIPINKPEIVSDVDWSFVKSVSALGETPQLLKDYSSEFADADEASLNTTLADNYYVGNGSYGFYFPAIKNAPVNIKRLFMFALADKEKNSGILKAIGALAAAGEWTDKSQGQHNFVFPGTTASIPLATGDKLFYAYVPGTSETYALINAKGEGKNYSVLGNSMTLPVDKSALAKYGVLVAHGGVTANKITLEDMEKKYPVFIHDWMVVEDYEKQSPDTAWFPGQDTDFDDAQAVKYIKAIQSPEVLGGEPELTDAEIASLPTIMKKFLSFAISDNSDYARIVAFKAHGGHYAAISKGVVPPNASYADLIANGQTDEYYVNNYWNAKQKLEYAADNLLDLGVPVSGSHVGKIIAAHIAGVLIPPAPVSGVDSSSSEWILTKNKNPKGLGGLHKKDEWFNQFGAELMTKQFNSDPNGPARVDAETAGINIGRLFGFNNPEARTMMVGGKVTYVQVLTPAQHGNIGYYSIKDLSDEVLAQAMSEHVLDWIISNHDSHQGNLLLSPDGKKVIGIDKGQAFKFFPEDQLAYGYLPPGNGEAVWYDKFYQALIQGTISKERADKIVAQVLLRAKKIQDRSDARYRELLTEGLSRRYNWPSQLPTMEKFIDALMERKHNLYADFEKFYKGLYASSPYSYDVDITPLLKAKINDDIHASLTQDLVDEVLQAKVHGKALMVNSTDFEDGHVLLYTEKAYDGSTVFKGEAKLRANADKTLMTWLKAQDIKMEAGSNSVGYDPYAAQLVNNAATLPMNDVWFSALQQGVSTVHGHVEDGQYNSSKIQALADVVAAMINAQSQIPETQSDGSVKTKDYFGGNSYTFEDQDKYDAWLAMINSYLAIAAEINSAKNNQIKTSYSKTLNPLKQITYTPKPKKEVKAEKGANVAGEYTSSSAPYSLQKLSNGKWKQIINVSGEAFDIDSEQAEAMIKADGMTASESANVAVGTKVLKVTKRQATSTVGAYDFTTGDLKHSALDSAGLSQINPGYQYDIEYSGVKIEYRPWNEASTATSQKGLLRFSVLKHDGTVEPVEDVFDTLKTLGLDLTEADEQGLELLYWRSISGHVPVFKDSNKYAAIINGFPTIVAQANSGAMSPDQELEAIKALWAQVIGKDKVDKADFMPYFSHHSLHEASLTTGRPQWLRPDVTLAELHKKHNNTTLRHEIHSNGMPILDQIVASGALYSSEERLRVLGQRHNGMSSYGSAGSHFNPETGEGYNSDQDTGGANYIFTRQNLHPSGGVEVFMMPHVALRTSNFSFGSDKWGNLFKRKEWSSYHPDQMFSHNGGGNELDVKTAISFLDDVAVIVAQSAQMRNKILDVFKKAGVTDLHGVPIEEVVLTADYSTAKAEATMKKMWDYELAIEAAK